MDESLLKEKLNNIHHWPSVYVYKFIIPADHDKDKAIRKLFSNNAEVYYKKSANGNYISITGKETVNSAEEVIQTYKDAYKIEGVIAL